VSVSLPRVYSEPLSGLQTYPTLASTTTSLKSGKTPTTTKAKFYLSSQSLAQLHGTDPRITPLVQRAIQITKVDFGIPQDGGLRTSERQRELFELKVSQCDGYHHKSYHQFGRAFDVYAYVEGDASWDEKHLALVAAAILQAANELGYRVEWGGLWASQDMPHFQFVN